MPSLENDTQVRAGGYKMSSLRSQMRGHGGTSSRFPSTTRRQTRICPCPSREPISLYVAFVWPTRNRSNSSDEGRFLLGLFIYLFIFVGGGQNHAIRFHGSAACFPFGEGFPVKLQPNKSDALLSHGYWAFAMTRGSRSKRREPG